MPRAKTMPDADVVRATARVLLRQGPARTTLAAVAAEAGLAAATLVQRFGSRRGLMLAFATAAAADAATPFARARAAVASPLGALREALVGVARDLRSRQEIANSLAVLLDDLTDDAMLAAAREHATATETAVRELLDAAVAAGELAPTDTRALALAVQAAWNGAIIQWALRGGGTFAGFLNGILAPLLPALPGATAAPRRPRTRRTR